MELFEALISTDLLGRIFSIQLVTFQQMINKRAWFKYYLLELRMISGSVNSIIASTVDMLLCTRGSQLAASCRLTHYKSFTVTRSRAEQRCGCQAGCQVPDSPCHLPPRFSAETNQELIIVYQTMPALLRPCCTQCFFKSIFLSGFWGGCNLSSQKPI